MKTVPLSIAAFCAVLIGGCVLPSPPSLVTIQSEPAPVVYQPGYVVPTLPSGYRTVRYHRNVYYVNRNVYYRPHQHGYVVVQQPY